MLTLIKVLFNKNLLPLQKFKSDKMIKNTLFVLSIISILSLFSNCKVNSISDFDTSISNSEWAIPLVDSKKSIKDILKDFDDQATLKIATDGGLTLHYKGDYIAKSSLDIFSAFQNALFPVLDTAMAAPLKLPKGVLLDYVNIKQGTLEWFFRSPINESLDVTVRIPQISKAGVPFQVRLTATPTGVAGSLNLTGWVFTSQNDSLYLYHDARKANGERVNLKNNGLFTIKDFQFSFIKGFMGVDTLDIPRDTIKMDFFDNLKQGEVKFESPKMTLTADNSFGFPVRAFSKIANAISVNGQILNLQSPLINGVDVNYPSLNEIGQTKRTIVTLDKNNSNLVNVTSFSPKAIDYDIDGISNPDPSVKTIGFMTDTSAFNLQVELDLPMHLTAKNFILNDTFDIDFSNYSDVKTAELKVITDNGIPMDLSLQGYFATANGTVIDSFYTSATAILKGASVNTATGFPSGVTTTTSTVKVEADKFPRILPAKKLIIRHIFATTNNGAYPVILTASQDVRVRIGVKFGLK